MIISANVLRQVKEIADYYVTNKSLTRDQAYDIAQSESAEELIEALQKYVKITDEDHPRIWMHIVNNIFVGVKTKDETRTVCNEYEIIFLKYLIRNSGVMMRQYVKREIMPNEYRVDETASNLASMKLINTFRLNNYEAVYVLNMDFYREVMKSGNN